MLYKKCALLLAVCSAALTHGAASDSPAITHTKHNDGYSFGETKSLLAEIPTATFDLSAMGVSSLFHIDTIVVPDDELIHMPFVGGRIVKPIDIIGNPLIAFICYGMSRRFFGQAGFISGTSQEGVSALANAASIFDESVPYFNEDYHSLLCSDATMKASAISNNSALYALVEDCKLTRMRLNFSRDGDTISYGEERSSYGWVCLPDAYKPLLDCVKASRDFNNIAELVASIKAAASSKSKLVQKKDPNVRLVSVPMLVLPREHWITFRREAFSSGTR
jgi:hypothetical protein